MKTNITKKDVLFCRDKVAEYEARAKEYEAKARAADCKPSQRGPYMSQAKQRRDDALRMAANEAAQMGWLAENNYDLWLELRGA